MAEEIAGLDFKALLVEAQELNIQYNGDDPVELHALITLARSDVGKDHPVPCFGLSYDPTNRCCRICQLRDPCADKDKRPRIEVLEAKLQPVPCDACGKGLLEIECEDEWGELRDYACSTKGCPNTIAIQCGWESIDTDQVVREIVVESSDPSKPEPKPEPKPESEPVAEQAVESTAKQTDAPVESEQPEQTEPAKTPKLRVIRGGSKSDPKKTKKSSKKKTSTKKTVRKPKPVVKNAPKVRFVHKGETYNSMSVLVNEITGSTNYSANRFFKIDSVKALQPGDVVEREWRGFVYRVEVISE